MDCVENLLDGFLPELGACLGYIRMGSVCILLNVEKMKVVFLKLLSQMFPQCWEVPLLDLLFKTGVDAFNVFWTWMQFSGSSLDG